MFRKTYFASVAMSAWQQFAKRPSVCIHPSPLRLPHARPSCCQPSSYAIGHGFQAAPPSLPRRWCTLLVVAPESPQPKLMHALGPHRIVPLPESAPLTKEHGGRAAPFLGAASIPLSSCFLYRASPALFIPRHPLLLPLADHKQPRLDQIHAPSLPHHPINLNQSSFTPTATSPTSPPPCLLARAILARQSKGGREKGHDESERVKMRDRGVSFASSCHARMPCRQNVRPWTLVDIHNHFLMDGGPR